ncbi:hypothetical protein ACFXB3_20100 [Streptomyces sp. NPDC059447]|uniref:hypothetical protein n=1 Tax=Streptomyces sp. NPDC059447 TaxID=3346834 RepID=UPI003696B545
MAIPDRMDERLRALGLGELRALAAQWGRKLGGRHAGHPAGETPAANPMCARADAYSGFGGAHKALLDAA